MPNQWLSDSVRQRLKPWLLVAKPCHRDNGKHDEQHEDDELRQQERRRFVDA
jgi:hypothetical protein